MTTRILLSDGKYCYAGPNCRLHSPSGIVQASRLKQDAMDAVFAARTLDEMADAKKALRKAMVAYDATTEGQALLRQQIGITSDAMTQAHYQQRLDAAKVWEREAEEAAVVGNEDGLVSSLTFSSKEEADSWEVSNIVGVTKVQGELSQDAWSGKQSAGILGAKSAKAKFLPLLKQAQKDGYLPANLKYSVTVPSYNVMNVEVRGLSDEAIGGIEADGYGENRNMSENAQELQRRISTLANTFSYSQSNASIDYFNSGFYPRVELETELRRKSRIREQVRKETVTKNTKYAKQVKGLMSRDISGGLNYDAVLQGSKEVASDANGKVLRWDAEDSRLFTLVDSSGKAYGVFNFSSVSVPVRPNESEEAALASNLLGILGRNDQHGWRAVNKRKVA